MTTPNKKNEILKAASECFAHYGYDKTSLDDIGKMVGLNKASLYYYYKSKETIFMEVIYREAEEHIGKVLEDVEQVEDCKEKVLTFLIKRIEYISHAANLNKLTIDGMSNMKPMAEALYEKNMENEAQHLAHILECCIKKGEIIDCDTKKIAKTILTITEAIKYKTANSTNCSFPSDINYSEAVKEVVFTVSLILDGLKAR
jgi:AcrR family transcriptional regulator